MRLQHNIAAMNANGKLKASGKKLNKSIEKLASGYSINKASDNAAGLSISEKMKAVIGGLDQAEKNIEDGISLVNVADAAMEEIHSILNRMTELSVLASNGTYDDAEREIIQAEVEHLVSEVDTISRGTNFNGIKLLRGAVQDMEYHEEGELPSWIGMTNSGAMTETYITNETYTDASGNRQTISIEHDSASIDFSSINGGANSIDELVGKGFHFTCCTCSNYYSIRLTDDSTNSMETMGGSYVYNIGINGVTNASDLIDRIIAGTQGGNPQNHYSKLAKSGDKLIIYDDRSNGTLPQPSGVNWDSWQNSGYIANSSLASGMGLFDDAIMVGSYPPGTYKEITLQIGDKSNEQLVIELPCIDLDTLRLTGLTLISQESAMDSSDRINNARRLVSLARADMGAYQNRLEHSKKYVSNTKINTQASESRIRDTDMAKEMMKYTKENILMQSGTAMLAQANMYPQGVLQLLQ